MVPRTFLTIWMMGPKTTIFIVVDKRRLIINTSLDLSV